MPFVDPFDPDTPDDVDLVSEGDDRIRELKRALTERLSQLVNDWPDGDVDGNLTLKKAAILPGFTTTVVTTDLLENRVAPTAAGEFFYATDYHVLYASVEHEPGLFEWRVTRAVVFTGTEFPFDAAGAPTALFYNTESGNLYLALDPNWIAVGFNQTLDVRNLRAVWEPSNPAGEMATFVQNARTLGIRAIVTTDIDGYYLFETASLAAATGVAFTGARQAVASARVFDIQQPLIAYVSEQAGGLRLEVITHNGSEYQGLVDVRLHITYDP